MNRFNLTFSGEILSGEEPEDVKRRFADAFQIKDAQRLERFFGGEPIILRRNLERKDAAQCFVDMRRIGIIAELVKVTPEELAWEENARRRSPKNQTAKESATDHTSTSPDPAKKEPKSAAEKPAEKPAETREDPLTKDTVPPKKKSRRRTRKTRVAAQSTTSQHPVQKTERSGTHTSKEAPQPTATAERSATQHANDPQTAANAVAEGKQDQQSQPQAARPKAKTRANKKGAKGSTTEEHDYPLQLGLQLAEEKAKEDPGAAAKKQAQLEAKKQAALEKRKQAAARKEKQANKETQKRNAAAAAAQRKAQREQQKAAEKIRREELRAQEKHRRAQEARAAEAALRQQQIAQQEAQRALAQQRAKEEASRHQAAEEAAREKILRDIDRAKRVEEERRQSNDLEEGAIERGGAELTRGAAIKPVQAKVRTRLGVAPRDHKTPSKSAVAAAKRRRAGEPNFYTLNAFRVTPFIRNRAERSRETAHVGAKMAIVGCLLLALVILGQRQLPMANTIAGISAAATDSAGNLFLLASDRLLQHNRAGVAVEEITLASLGVTQLLPPLRFSQDGHLYALGRAGSQDTKPQLLRCDLAQPSCDAALPPASGALVDTYQLHPIDGSIFVADAANERLQQFGADGTLVGDSKLALPALPGIELHSGLLFVNSADGPAIKVLRYDTNAFGQQLDEVLLLPTQAVEAGLERVGSFLYHAGQWWVVLYQQSTGAARVFRFDEEWGLLGSPRGATTTLPISLLRWGDKVLAYSDRSRTMERFSVSGDAETPFISTSLQGLFDERSQRNRLHTLAVKALWIAALVLVIYGVWVYYINKLKALVYKSTKERGAEPVDELSEQFEWIDAAQRRTLALRRRLLSWGLLSAACCMVAIGLGVTTSQLLALLIALAGPLIGLSIVMRSPIGHIGSYEKQLMLVDHKQLYQLGAAAEIQYRGAFLLLHDVVVYCGNAALPTFNAAQVNQKVAPIARGAVKIDRPTLLVKLLESRPPVVQGAFAIGLCLVTAVLCLVSPWIFSGLT